MILWAVAISGLLILVTARDWRKGLLAVLLLGVLQDLFRKLTQGAPAYFILWSVAVYVLVVLAALASRALPGVSALYLHDNRVRAWLLGLLAVLALQLLHSLIRYGNPAIPILGGMFYLGPMIALLTAVAYVDSEPRLRQYLTVYLAIFVPACLTVYLSPGYSDAYPALRDIGSFTGNALLIFDVGTVLQSNSGLLRVGEIAAWHAATCVMFLSILSFLSRSVLMRLLNVALGLLLVGVIVLTGRRKMLVALTVFFALQWGLLVWYRWGQRRIGMVLLALALVGSLGLAVYQPSQELANYLARSQTAYTSVDDRLVLTLDLAESAIYRSEGFGLGAGATSQGARYAGGGASAEVGGAAEAGLSKVIVELGIPGFLLLTLLLISGGLAIRRQIKYVTNLGQSFLVYDVSFIAFLVSNIAAFAVASQLFGDFFVLIVIGTVAGFMVRIHAAAMQTVGFGNRSSAQAPGPEVARTNR